MIYKSEVKPGEVLHVIGKPIHVAVQRETWQCWYIYGEIPHDVIVVGTGPGNYDTEAAGYEYLNTFMEHEGILVWHAFTRNSNA